MPHYLSDFISKRWASMTQQISETAIRKVAQTIVPCFVESPFMKDGLLIICLKKKEIKMANVEIMRCVLPFHCGTRKCTVEVPG